MKWLYSLQVLASRMLISMQSLDGQSILLLVCSIGLVLLIRASVPSSHLRLWIGNSAPNVPNPHIEPHHHHRDNRPHWFHLILSLSFTVSVFLYSILLWIPTWISIISSFPICIRGRKAAIMSSFHLLQRRGVGAAAMLTRPRGPLLSRGMATATKAKEILPLKGVKVLDMTRVLAGVSTIFSLFLIPWSGRVGDWVEGEACERMRGFKTWTGKKEERWLQGESDWKRGGYKEEMERAIYGQEMVSRKAFDQEANEKEMALSKSDNISRRARVERMACQTLAKHFWKTNACLKGSGSILDFFMKHRTSISNWPQRLDERPRRNHTNYNYRGRQNPQTSENKT